ncbi:MAG: hypothetical protein ABSB42_09950 [Tepidisphaeraceae bacterium]|jgi:hypothetical protein
MAAVGPQSSGGGLIAAVVVFTILFVAATIFAIYFGVDDGKIRDQLQVEKNNNKLIFSSQDLGNLRYAEIKSSLKPGQSILSVALQDSQELAETIDGKLEANKKQPVAAAEQARKALANAAQKLPALNLTPSMNLVSVIDKLTAYGADQQYQNTLKQMAQDQAAGDAARQIALLQQEVQKAQDDVTAADKVKNDALDRAQKAENDSQLRIKQMAQSMDVERGQMNSELQKAQESIAAKGKELDQETKLAMSLTDKLAGHRISPVDPLLRQPDGTIASVASDEIVYINLGQGDHIVPGMTFEVYSRREGIPKQEDLMSAENMPIGEASIEVEQVLASVSQCRVTKMEIGQHIAEGDLIANLVYDRNTKYNLVVYGDFDLGQTGKAKKGDMQKIEALVTDWGGHVQKDIDVDTDFVVMGSEPKIDIFSPDDLNDPLMRQMQQNEKAAYDAYQAVLEKAEKLGIPIMNQNRFLYFCGYYNSAQR